MKGFTKIWIFLLTALCSVSLLSVDANAASKKPSTTTKIIDMNLINQKSTNRVKVKAEKGGDDYYNPYNELGIYVDGRKVNSIMKTFAKFTCSAFRLKNGRNYLFVTYQSDEKNNLRGCLYRYSKKNNRFFQEIDVGTDMKNLLGEDYTDSPKDFSMKLHTIKYNTVYIKVGYYDLLLGKTYFKAVYNTKKDQEKNKLQLAKHRYKVLGYEAGRAPKKSSKYNPLKINVLTTATDFKVKTTYRKTNKTKLKQVEDGQRVIIKKIYFNPKNNTKKYWLKQFGWINYNNNNVFNYFK